MRKKKTHLDYSFSWGFFLLSVLSLPFQGNGNNFLFSVSLEASFSYSMEKCGAVFFFFSLSCLLQQCWKPFDLQSRVLLTDWCFHTVTLAESLMLRGLQCHSGTNAQEFSQIIPLWVCLCVVPCWFPGKTESIYVYNCLFVSLCSCLLLVVVFIKGGWRDGAVLTFDVKGWRGDVGFLWWQLRY